MTDTLLTEVYKAEGLPLPEEEDISKKQPQSSNFAVEFDPEKEINNPPIPLIDYLIPESKLKEAEERIKELEDEVRGREAGFIKQEERYKEDHRLWDVHRNNLLREIDRLVIENKQLKEEISMLRESETIKIKKLKAQLENPGLLYLGEKYKLLSDEFKTYKERSEITLQGLRDNVTAIQREKAIIIKENQAYKELFSEFSLGLEKINIKKAG